MQDHVRRVRLRSALARWWPFGLTTGLSMALIAATAAVLLMAEGWRMPWQDDQLDRTAVTALDPARVTEVRRTGTHFGSRHLLRIGYEARAEGTDIVDHCYMWTPAPAVGQPFAFEYLEEQIAVRRLRGTRFAAASLWMPDLLGWVLLPVALLFATWVIGVWRLLGVLRHGRGTVARLLEAKRTSHVNPPQLRLRYEFTAGDGSTVGGKQWLRANSPLGRRLAGLAPGAEIPLAIAVHDPQRPRHCRLLAAEDIL